MTRRPRRPHGSAGFTLLEVLIAVAVLGLGLTMILTAQTGIVTSSRRAQSLSQAVGLARCKMNELEEQLLREGFSLTAEDENGPCCEDDESQFLCEWSIVPVELPELGTGLGSGADAGAGEGASPLGAPLGGDEGAAASLGALGGAREDLMAGDTAGALGAIAGAGSGGPSMGASALAPIAMGIVYPQLKAMLEASIRKVQLRVSWKEGRSERDLAVTQYVTNPQQGGLMDLDESGEPAGASGASPADLPP